MSKALTPVKQNDERHIRSAADRLITRAQNPHFASYFRNFGIFSPLLLLFINVRFTQRHFGGRREFPLLTAIMAIV